MLSADAPDLAFVSIVFLPRSHAQSLRRTALDRALATPLLAATYSANAYPFSLRYQNCNQWVAELLATAWAPLAASPDGPPLRQRAQDWLRQTGYVPTTVNIDSHLTKVVAGFMPLLHLDDHPADAQLGMRLQVSLPAAIEAYAHAQAPQAQRIEFCHDQTHIVMRQGWQAMGDTCEAQPGDEVMAL